MCLCFFFFQLASRCYLRHVSSTLSPLWPVPEYLHIWEMNSGSCFVDESAFWSSNLLNLLDWTINCLPHAKVLGDTQFFHSGSVAFPCGSSVLCYSYKPVTGLFVPRFEGAFSFACPGVQDLHPKFQDNLLAPGPVMVEVSEPSLRFLSFDLYGLETCQCQPAFVVFCVVSHHVLWVCLNIEPSRQWGFR